MPATVQAGEPIALDTDVFSFIRNQRGPCDAFAALIDGHPWVLPFPVVGELKYGALRSKHGDKRIAGLEQAISACTIVTADARAVARCARSALHWKTIADLAAKQGTGQVVSLDVLYDTEATDDERDSFVEAIAELG